MAHTYLAVGGDLSCLVDGERGQVENGAVSLHRASPLHHQTGPRQCHACLGARLNAQPSPALHCHRAEAHCRVCWPRVGGGSWSEKETDRDEPVLRSRNVKVVVRENKKCTQNIEYWSERECRLEIVRKLQVYT